MRKAVGILLLVMAFCLTAVGGFLVYQKISGYRENEAIYDDVASIAVNRGSTGTDENPTGDGSSDDGREFTESGGNPEKIPGMEENEYRGESGDGRETETADTTTINWENLKGNPDIVGWITFGDVVNYPVMQGNDNSYYLKHAYNGVSNSNGSIFMNSNNDGNFRDMNTIIYGHNLKSGRMFGTFKQYTKKNGKDLHFYIYTPDGNRRTYEIVSIAEVKDGGFAYNYAFSKISEYRKYLDALSEASLYDTGYDCDPARKTVTLSTCRSTGSGEGWRVIIVGQESCIEKIQEAASWYEKPEDDHVTILDVNENIRQSTDEMAKLKKQRKQDEYESHKNGQEAPDGTNQH